MKQIIVIIISLILWSYASAQLPKWAIAPNYEQINIKVDNALLQTDSMGISSLWTMDGICLFKTEHFIHPYKDGLAVITKKGSDELVGFVDILGKFTTLPNIKIAYDHPYFEDEYLMCEDSKGGAYYKIDGSKAEFAQSVRSYPFHGGYAPYLTFDQFEKKKDPYYGYYCADGQPMAYRMIEKGAEKEIEPKDISFLSGIGYDNKGVAVIKNKLYLCNPYTKLFEPFFHGNDKSEKKRHLTLNGDYEKYFLNLPSDSIEIKAKYDNNQQASLQFDSELRPVRFVFDDMEQVFAKPESKKFKYSSEVESYGDGPKYGLAFRSKQLLPQQFEEVGLRYGNKALVKCNGKWGVIEIVPNLSYQLNINKGKFVAFRHQIFDTQIRLDLPAEISARYARIDIPAMSGCNIDKTSRETKDTESGNYVVYDCSLVIPDSLPDEETIISYSPISISYDDIHLFDTFIDIKAWHFKYYNVDPIESETSISNGILSFTININADKNVGEGDYPFEVTIKADSVSVETEKISETRRKFQVSNLKEGVNNLNILVTEKGCPPAVFPFEITYTKPVPRKKMQESAIIRKGEQTKKEQPKKELRIEL